MIQLLRAFGYLRWRLFFNSFKGAQRRDTLEKVSRAASSLAPIIFTVLFIPGLLALSALSVAGGYIAGGGGEYARIVIAVLRIFLAVITFAVVLAPIIRSIGRSELSITRLLLLPIPRPLLHLLDVAAGITDPWLALVAPVVLLFPAGLAAAGAFRTAAVALIAGVLLLALLLSLEACLAHALALLYRNRRRGEMVSLVILVSLSLMGLLPALLSPYFDPHPRHHRKESAAGAVQEGPDGSAGAPSEGMGPAGRSTESGGSVGAGAGQAEASAQAAETGKATPSAGRAGTPDEAPPRTDGDARQRGSTPESGSAMKGSSRAAPRGDRPSISIPRFIPSEMYALAIRPGPGAASSRGFSVAALAIFAALLYGVSSTAYSRLLDTPETGTSRRGGAARRVSVSGLPGLGPAASAVASAAMRLSLRTIQGKMAIYYTPVGLLVAAVAMSRLTEGGLTGNLGSHSGPILVAGASLLTLVAMHKLMLNQFAISGAGLTLQFLSPISERDLITGNAAGFGVFYAGSMVLYILLASLFAPDRSIALWAAALVAGLSTYMIFSPIASALSALFPRTVDLARMGKGSNPSAAASLLGMLATVIAAAPPVLLGVLGLLVLRSPALVLLFIAIWALFAGFLFVVLSRGAAGIVAGRRENLAMIAEGR